MVSADSVKVDTTALFYTMKGRRVYGGGGIIPDVFVPIDTTKVTDFYLKCNRKSAAVRFASAMFDRYRNQLAAIDDFSELEDYLQSIDLEAKFLDYALRVDGISPAAGEWKTSRTYMMPQINALVGRYSKLDNEAFYRFYIPIDDTIKAALEHPSTVE